MSSSPTKSRSTERSTYTCRWQRSMPSGLASAAMPQLNSPKRSSNAASPLQPLTWGPLLLNPRPSNRFNCGMPTMQPTVLHASMRAEVCFAHLHTSIQPTELPVLINVGRPFFSIFTNWVLWGVMLTARCSDPQNNITSQPLRQRRGTSNARPVWDMVASVRYAAAAGLSAYQRRSARAGHHCPRHPRCPSCLCSAISVCSACQR